MFSKKNNKNYNNKNSNFFNKKTIHNKKKIKFKKFNKINNLDNIKKRSNTHLIEKKNKFINKNIKDKSIFSKKKFFNKFKISFLKKNKINKDKKNNINKNNIKKKFFIKNISNITKINIIKNKNFKKKYTNINNKKNELNKEEFLLKNKKVMFLKQNFIKPKNIVNKKIVLNKNISIKKLSSLLGIKINKIYKKISDFGIKLKDNFLKFEDAKLISEFLGYVVKEKKNIEMKDLLIENRNFSNMKLKRRPPIVAIMGHVDHGKTSILDCIRLNDKKIKEFGGITQNIVAYNIKKNNNTITFLDTPGHKVFSKMRSRGAEITDLIVLVVAADDGVMPQTIEAINHAKKSNVPIIIAINKIDKLEKNIDFIKNELMKYEIVSEEFGGENMFVLVSAKLNKGINSLLDAILLQSEILELKTFYKCIAKGVVIESFLDKKKGIISIVLVKEGTLKIGDFIICGLEYGKIRAINDEYGNFLSYVTPSIPAKIFGLSGIPISGSNFTVVKNEKKAIELICNRKNKYKHKKNLFNKKFKTESFLDDIKLKNLKELKLLIKADSQGSLEAIYNEISNLSNKNSLIKIVYSGVGSVNETDVSLAVTFKAIIIAFNVYPNKTAKKNIILNKLDIRYYSIIYNLLNEIEELKNKFLYSESEKKICGIAEIKNVFKVSNSISVAGCIVLKGLVICNHNVNIIRNKKIVFKGKIESIKHFKKNVKEVKSGLECGIIIQNYNKIKIKDILEILFL
ncbi:translation initiation factor IF-2 [Buchnera aphidicola (Ceratoglyphina bambusae)]|uniref:translation initiation factor IF-2 n=1 Tax=Buchnera aphidicola TaxID=9 RepID=UPI0031B815C0